MTNEREALAELVAAHERNTLYSGSGHWDRARAVLAQPEPEPVAWRSFDVARQKAYYDEVPITSIQPGAYTHTPLYAAPPPARVPVLTDEQIDAIGIKMLGKGYGGNTDREFARAVLAAATQGSKP